MVVNPDPKWDKTYLAAIDHLEQTWAIPKGWDHICGFPTKNGTPCRNQPTDIGGKIVNGRCSVHGGTPKISNFKKAIITKKIDFMKCDTCDIASNGSCDQWRKNQSCPIEAEIYERLWDNFTTIFEFKDFPSQVILDSIIRDFIRQDRAWRLENVIGTMWAEKSGICGYYDRATRSILSQLEKLNIKVKGGQIKSFTERMKDLNLKG